MSSPSLLRNGSTFAPRFAESADLESRVSRPFRGHTRVLSVALNYAGSDAPLECVVDCERLTTLAKKDGVRDIVKLYDNGSTKKHPSVENVKAAFTKMCGRAKEGDFLVFQFSGHGSNQENAEEASGFDTILCLTKDQEGGEDDWLDNDLSAFIFSVLPAGVSLLCIIDACHSAGTLDLAHMKQGGLSATNAVVILGGCQDTQCSTDTGDGGQMTLVLLQTLRKKASSRKARKASVQMIFNRMVAAMPEEEEEPYEEENVGDEFEEGDFFDDDEEWEDEELDGDWEDEECDEDEGYEEVDEGVDPTTGDEPEPGQTINLMWMGKDPAQIAFPF